MMMPPVDYSGVLPLSGDSHGFVTTTTSTSVLPPLGHLPMASSSSSVRSTSPNGTCKSYLCNRCGREYASTDAVRKHARQNHPDWFKEQGQGRPSLYCTAVEKAYGGRSAGSKRAIKEVEPSNGGWWTPKEDAIIMSQVANAQYGSKWKNILKLLPGRNTNAVRRRYRRLVAPAAKPGGGGGKRKREDGAGGGQQGGKQPAMRDEEEEEEGVYEKNELRYNPRPSSRRGASSARCSL